MMKDRDRFLDQPFCAFVLLFPMVLIAIIYYIGILNDADTVSKEIRKSMKMMYFSTGRDMHGNFIETTITEEKDDPTTYYTALPSPKDERPTDESTLA